MSLSDDVKDDFAKAVADDPLWVAMAKSDGSVKIEGEVGETVQAVAQCLMAAITGVTHGMIRLAEAVDELRDEASV